MKQVHAPNRLIALLLAVTMLLSAAACGGRETSPDASSSTPQDTSSTGVPAFVNPLPDADLSAVAEPKKPEGDLLEKLNTAYNQNNDVVGWLSVPDTTMDDPVMFCENDANTQNDPDPENRNFYQRRDINKQYDWYGSYWVDYECKLGDRNELSRNTIIYGHSMDDDPEGLKMSQLKKYNDIEWAKQHLYIYFSTAEDEMVWKVFAVSTVDTNLAYNHPDLSDADFMNLISELKDRSVYDIDVDVKSTDKILLISTCTYPTNYTNVQLDESTKYLIVARLLRPGEEETATVEMTVNEDVKKPQYNF